MDISFTKHKIVTEEPPFCLSGEIPVQCNINSSEGDLKKILKCSSDPQITSKSVSGRIITLEGTLSVQVICLDSDCDLICLEHTIPFSKTFEGDSELDGAEITADISEEKLSATLSSDRQVTVSGTIDITVCVRKQISREVICDIDCKDIEQLKNKAQVTTPMGRGERNLIVEEEISIGNGQPSVGCLIRHSATAAVEEAKIIGNKVMVKGSVKIYVLYLPEEGTRPQNFEESFPFSQLVDVEGINDACKCDATVKMLFCDLTPQVGTDDEIRSFSVAAKLGLLVKAYCDDELPIVLDAYSTKDRMKPIKEGFVFKRICENLRDRFIAKKDLEFSDGAIGSVIDMWCEIKKSTVKAEKQGFKVMGTVLVNILAYDCDGIPECYEKPVDFEYTYHSEAPFEMPEITYSLTISHASYTIIRANTLAVAVEPEICATLYDSKKYEPVTDMVEDLSEEISDRKSSIVLYFADAGETLWDIARRYNSSVEEIKTLNSVTEDVLSLPKKFIIPTK